MYSHKMANFESDYDLVALGIQNVWICEVGSKEVHGSFENFTSFILNSSVMSYNCQKTLEYLILKFFVLIDFLKISQILY